MEGVLLQITPLSFSCTENNDLKTDNWITNYAFFLFACSVMFLIFVLFAKSDVSACLVAICQMETNAR